MQPLDALLCLGAMMPLICASGVLFEAILFVDLSLQAGTTGSSSIPFQCSLQASLPSPPPVYTFATGAEGKSHIEKASMFVATAVAHALANFMAGVGAASFFGERRTCVLAPQ